MTKNRMNYERFHGLLETAIGRRTQKAFAQKCGVSPQYLNKLLRRDIRPARSTLYAFAQHAEGNVTYHDFLSACGYASGTEREKGAIYDDDIPPYRFDDGTYFVKIAAAQMDHRAYPYIEEKGTEPAFDGFADDIADKANLMIPDGEPFSGEVLNIRRLNKAEAKNAADSAGNAMTDADFAAEMQFSYETSRFTQRIKAVALAKESRRALVCRMPAAAAALAVYFPDAVPPLGTEETYDPLEMWSETAYRSEEDAAPYGKRLANALARLQGKGQKILTALDEGLGFYTDDVKKEDVLAAIKHHGVECSGDPFACYAHIMEGETGISFSYAGTEGRTSWSDEKYPENRPCIMVSDDAMGNFDRKTVLNICRKYAAETGAKKYGTVWVQYEASMPKDPEYRTPLPDPEKIREAQEEFADNQEDDMSFLD